MTGMTPPDPSPRPYVETDASPDQARYAGQPRHSAPIGDQTSWDQRWMPQAGADSGHPSATADGPAGPIAPTGPPGAPDYSVYLLPTRRAIGIVGLVIALAGVVLVAVSFSNLNWLSTDEGAGTTVSFKDLHDLVGSGSPGLTRFYFEWLAWALLGAVAVLALLANLPLRSHAGWRVLGLAVGLGGAVCTFFAIYNDGTTLHDLVKFGAVGFWLAQAGFLLAGLGAVVGPRRVRG